MAPKKNLEIELNVKNHSVLLNTGMSEDQIDEAIGFALQCNQKLEADYETPNEQLVQENKQLVLEWKKLTYNIEVQTMLLMRIKKQIWTEAYETLKQEVLSWDEFKKLTERNGL